MLAAALALGLVMGAVVGGLGGGGGVLTVPTLVYVLGQTAHDATTSSVIIVGITAAVGALARIRGRGIDWRIGIALGIVGIPAAYLGTLLNRHVGQPVLLLAFAGLTLAAAAAMLLDARSSHDARTADDQPATGSGGTGTALDTRSDTGRRTLLATLAKVVLCGAAIGFLTGFLGVGGGFLVVPALVIVLRMPMALAIGTSLLVIVLNAISSVASRLGDMHLDRHVVVPFTVAAVGGTLLGKRVADRLSRATLATSFAVMLIAVGIFVGVQSLVTL
jgi:uncharacterized membrane protein YfcA